MNIERQMIQGKGLSVPCIMLTPESPKGAAVVVHGYGGCKEEQLGLAWRIAEKGIAACSIDLRGHGENKHPMDWDMIDDVEAALDHCKGFGKVAAIGHSMGGRVCLLSKAEYKIGISPAYSKTYGPRTHQSICNSRDYRVIQAFPDALFRTLAAFPEWQYDGGNALIVYGSRDLPEIFASCEHLKNNGTPAVLIDKALHSDIFLLEETFKAVSQQLEKWFA
jgi:hypothetical protein